MLRWQTLVGVILGLVAGGAILGLTGSPERRPVPCGPILSECDGHLRELVLHYVPSAKEIVAPVYRDFLRALDSDVGVHLVCPDRPAFDDFLATVGHVKCRVSPILTGHPITTWSRDRWVALAPAVAGGATTLWSPRGEASEEIWPARAGDERVGRDIAAALAPAILARRSGLYFDGGDFLADSDTVFVVPRVLQRNLQQTVRNRQEFLNLLALQLKRRVILLDDLAVAPRRVHIGFDHKVLALILPKIRWCVFVTGLWLIARFAQNFLNRQSRFAFIATAFDNHLRVRA